MKHRYCMTRLEAVLASSITMSQCYWTVWSQRHVVKRQHDSLLYSCHQPDVKLFYFSFSAQPSYFFSWRLQFVFVQQTGPFDGLLLDPVQGNEARVSAAIDLRTTHRGKSTEKSILTLLNSLLLSNRIRPRVFPHLGCLCERACGSACGAK